MTGIRPKLASILRSMVVACALTGAPGCDDGDSGSSKTPVGPDLRGKWDGIYYFEGIFNTATTELTAKISQNADAIVLTTSLSGTGARFTGQIDADGTMLLTDSQDGEVWTTSYPATETLVEISDERPDIAPGVRGVIRLTR